MIHYMRVELLHGYVERLEHGFCERIQELLRIEAGTDERANEFWFFREGRWYPELIVVWGTPPLREQPMIDNHHL